MWEAWSFFLQMLRTNQKIQNIFQKVDFLSSFSKIGFLFYIRPVEQTSRRQLQQLCNCSAEKSILLQSSSRRNVTFRKLDSRKSLLENLETARGKSKSHERSLIDIIDAR